MFNIITAVVFGAFLVILVKLFNFDFEVVTLFMLAVISTEILIISLKQSVDNS
jgi:hypothetical protein